MGDLSGLLVNAGASVVQGFIDGVESMIGALQSKLSQLTNMIPQVKGPPDKDKVLLRENGRLVIAGFIGGIEAEIPRVAATLGRFTDSMGATFAVKADDSGLATAVRARAPGRGRRRGAVVPLPRAGLRR